jgi:hypothetical protein
MRIIYDSSVNTPTKWIINNKLHVTRNGDQYEFDEVLL